MVRFIGADGSEQLPIRFLLRRTSVDEPPYIVDVTCETEFDEWPNMSRKCLLLAQLKAKNDNKLSA
jgi:hypothetical protein